MDSSDGGPLPVEIVLVGPDDGEASRLEALLHDEVALPIQFYRARHAADALERITEGVDLVVVEATESRDSASSQVREVVGASGGAPVIAVSRGAVAGAVQELQTAGATSVIAGDETADAELARAIRAALGEIDEPEVLGEEVGAGRYAVGEAGEDLFRLAFEHAPVGMALVDPAGTWLEVNPAACGILGYDSAALRGTAWDQVIHPSDLETVRDEGRRLLAVGETELMLDLRFILASGGIIRTRAAARAVKGADGSPRLFVVQIQDMSTEWRREAAREFLWDAAQLLMEPKDLDQVVRTLAWLAVPRLADCIAVVVAEEGRPATTFSAAANPGKAEILSEITNRYPPEKMPPTSPVARVIAQGRSRVWPTLTPAQLKEFAYDADHLTMLEQLAPGSLMIVPLTASGRVFGGALLATSESGHRYTLDDLRTAEELAHLTALAVRHARYFGPVPAEATTGVSTVADSAPATSTAQPEEDLLRGLTDQERKVLSLAARGYPAADIAERLFLSPRTVETYRARAMNKLDLSSRADLIDLAVRAGILAP